MSNIDTLNSKKKSIISSKTCNIKNKTLYLHPRSTCFYELKKIDYLILNKDIERNFQIKYV